MAVVDKVITSPRAKDGMVGEKAGRKLKKQDYLGMTLDFSVDCKFVVDTDVYLDKILSRLYEDMDRMTTTLASDHLFKTRDNTLKLNKERAELFHCATVQIPFVAQRGRSDL